MKNIKKQNGTEVNLLQDNDFEYIEIQHQGAYKDTPYRIYRYPDGSMKIYGVEKFIKKDTSPVGSDYFTFPVKFKDWVHVNIANIYTHSNAIFYNPLATTETCTVYYRKTDGEYAIGETVDFYYEAIGRWK